MPRDAGPHNSGQRTVLLLKWWAPKVTQKKGPWQISGPGLGVPESTSDSKGSHIFIRIKNPRICFSSEKCCLYRVGPLGSILPEITEFISP